MCGIFGIITSKIDASSINQIHDITNDLFKISESRGKDASGIAIKFNDKISILKGPIKSSELIKTQQFQKFWNSAILNNNSQKQNTPLVILGHSRMVTNGTPENNCDNQPLIKKTIVGVFNGIITNEKELWEKNPDLPQQTTTDTEILFGLIGKYFSETKDFKDSVNRVFSEIEGAASFGVLSDNSDKIALATNNGSLYTLETSDKTCLIFSSEKSFLQKISKKYSLKKAFDFQEIFHIIPNVPLILDLKKISTPIMKNINSDNGILHQSDILHPTNAVAQFEIISERSTNVVKPEKQTEVPQYLKDEYSSFSQKISKIKRCTKCILPETFPFIEFDNKGVCNYCRGHHPINKSVKGTDELEKIIKPFRKSNGEPDCFIAISGGRDSCFGLHYVKNVLHMTPLAYTYDWGMVTDLARRNISRMCGKLGVEHILISADISKKRENVRKNINAWLKKPDLGMVPIFMAGDKQFLYYAYKLMQENDIQLFIWFTNTFEISDFKEGFCGVSKMNLNNPARTWTLSTKNKIRLVYYYVLKYLQNPKYLNKSIFDNIFAFYSYYILPEYNIYLFNYIPWDEKEIMGILNTHYNWETAPDTQATWRVGDGTAAFYNYIYYTATGFSEFDTFLSKQIREGTMSREEALIKSSKFNFPRYDSLIWYADTVGFDLEFAINVIHAMPKLYEK